MKIRDSLVPRYAELIYNGFWFSPERELLQKTMDETQKTVNGTVRLKLYKGNCIPVGRKSDQSLYQESFATFEEDPVYDQGDATGFIRLNGLRLRIQALQEANRDHDRRRKRRFGKLWGGRFDEATAASVEAFTASIHYDSRLYKYDIAGSKAHATMLADNGILSRDELRAIIDGLTAIEAEIDSGTFTFRRELEDIHMNIEKALVDRIGPAGAKLHSARSRNDQIALDFKLYLRDQCDCLVDAARRDLQKAFVVLARNYLGAVMPGYTHMQRAQPVLISHHLLAYYEMFGRDRERFSDCRKRLNLSPLGCAAMAGTGLPIDREQVAEALGFDGVTANSMDTSGDRDFAIEFVSCCTLIQLHLSRLSEELVLWSGRSLILSISPTNSVPARRSCRRRKIRIFRS